MGCVRRRYRFQLPSLIAPAMIKPWTTRLIATTPKKALADVRDACRQSQPPSARRATLPASGQHMRPVPCEAKSKASPKPCRRGRAHQVPGQRRRGRAVCDKQAGRGARITLTRHRTLAEHQQRAQRKVDQCRDYEYQRRKQHGPERGERFESRRLPDPLNGCLAAVDRRWSPSPERRQRHFDFVKTSRTPAKATGRR